MMIKNHMIRGARYIASPNRSGFIDPKFIVMHYTAGHNASGAIQTLTRRGSRASAHVVVAKDGEIIQLVPFNVKAWHAGPSSYKGYNGLNSHSIGIEIVNIGWVRKLSSGHYEDWAGNILSEAELGEMVVAKHPTVGSGTYYWPVYTREQLDAVEKLTKELIREYDIRDIVSHEEIDTRGWKTDPGPAFPMNRFKKLLTSKGISNDRDMDEEFYEVTASSLNLRNGPGTRFSVAGSLPKGSIVPVLEKRGNWARINSDHWVYDAYLRVK
jgi:N-acetylmuramoyl-L-alanine amidase